MKLGLAFLLLLAVGAFYLRLAAGPISLESYADNVAASLARRIGPGWSVALRDTAVELSGAKPSVRTSGLEIRNPAGIVVVRSPFALVTLDPFSLLTGGFTAREIEFRGLHLRALLASDGTLSFVSGGDADGATAPSASPGPTPAVPADATVSTVSAAVSSLLDPVVRPTGIIGALDRAIVRDAQFTLVGADGRERAAFSKVGAVFERLAEGERRISIDLEGGHGGWQVRGTVGAGADRLTEVAIDRVPLADVLLLTGLGTLPDGSDLKLSGRATAAFNGRALSDLTVGFETSKGAIARRGRRPIPVDRAVGTARWDEARRTLLLSGIEAVSADTSVRLDGALATAADETWQLKLSGRDAVVGGVTRDDPAFRLDDLSADVSFGESGISVDRFRLKGEQLDILVSGASVPGQDGTGLRAAVEAKRTNIRRALRLWPDNLFPDLRAFLVDNLRAGSVDRFDLRTELGAQDLRQAAAGHSVSDPALSLNFALSDGKLFTVDGLPPIDGLALDGTLTGASARLTSRGGRVDVGEGRSLAFSQGSYTHSDYGSDDSVAQVGFRISGGADALAAFLRTPFMREAGAPDVDPAKVKGRADFRVSLPLAVHRMPPLAEQPVAVTGSVSDLSADGIVGREKLESANLSMTYGSGALLIKGDGRIGGSPATIEVTKTKGGIAEASIALTLDDAARARRSLPVGPQLAGPVGVKVSTQLSRGLKGVARVEVDLAKTSIDNLLPGWIKGANRPGRASFTLGEGDAPDLRDIVVESGPVQLRGHVSLGQGGGLERADVPTLKLSPGDDLRAQVERSGSTHKVVIRGNVGDARPIMRWVGSSAGQKEARDVPDIDLDLAVNIVTGHNDEAMTGVTARAVMRNKEVRSLKLGGRFRTARVDAELGGVDGGAPVLSARSTDAGATLRFLDLYKRMLGGTLSVDARYAEAAQEGVLSIDGFQLKGEPALRQIVGEGAPPDLAADDRTGIAPIARGEVDQVQFTKLSGGFRRAGSRIDWRDVVIWGPQVGFNLAGFVDFTRDRTDITGTFVPAYMLNNAFSQVPIVGMILGGGRNEGLFAIDFRVFGQASAPTLTVNPLTAVAPGILRKLFGWMMEGGDGSPPATGATRPRPPPDNPR